MQLKVISLKNPTTRIICRTLIFFTLFQRTLGGESFPTNLQQRRTTLRNHHNHVHQRHNYVLSQSSAPVVESSLENSVKYSRYNANANSNAIVRAIASPSTSVGRHSPSTTPFNFVSSGGAANKNVPTPLSLSTPTPSDDPAALPVEILRIRRLELIKQQILKKLRLTEPPRALPNQVAETNKDLPIPVLLGETLPKRIGPSPGDRDVEDFYGKTEQIIIFPDETGEGGECGTPLSPTPTRDPSSCFLFKLPREIRYEEVGSVEIWAFKLPDPNDVLESQSYYVNQVVSGLRSNSRERVRLAVKSGMNLSHGWFSLNLTSPVISWLKRQEYKQMLELGCPSCAQFDGSGIDLGSPVGTEGEERPFLVINMASRVVKKRSRRHINCSRNTTECCRERFVVDFKEIGWDWIVAPDKYDAYYCKGSCVSVNGLSSSASRRTSIIGGYLNTLGNNTAELVPCCTATRMSSISLIYNDWGNNSTTPMTRTEVLPNMVVETCGCL